MAFFYKTVVVLFVFVLSCSSCQDPLTEAPVNAYLVSDLTAGSGLASVKGIYEPLTRSRGRLYESWMYSTLESLGDYCNGNFSPYLDATQYNYTTASLQGNFSAFWTRFYEGIGRANTVLAGLKTSNIEPQLKTQYEAEARFMRALYYYHLVRLWGRVPLRLEPVANATDLAVPLSEISAVYAAIQADLEFAETNLPDAYPASDVGRATSGAAKVMLADTYLTRRDFPKALAKAKEIIDNKARWKYDLYTVGFDRLYSPTEPTNSEDVFSLKFIRQIGFGSFIPTYCHDPDAGYSNRGLRTIVGNEKSFYATWDKNDLRKSWNVYSMKDRKPVEADLSVPVYFRKFRDPQAPEETASGNNYYLYRYADVLLIFAEAENQVNGPTSAAYNAINQVRRRGYGVSLSTPSTVADLPSALTKQAFDDAVFQERGFEFMGETRRWFDMKRTGRIQSALVAAGKGNFYRAGSEYFPIPQTEIDNNPALR